MRIAIETAVLVIGGLVVALVAASTLGSAIRGEACGTLFATGAVVRWTLTSVFLFGISAALAVMAVRRVLNA